MRKHFTAAIILILVALLAAVGCSALSEAREVQEPEEKVMPKAPSEQVQVILHFADWQAQHVIPERREVDVTEDSDLPKALVELLLGGPEDPHLNRTFPEDVQMISVELEGSVAYVNLSSEVESIAGSAGQAMAMRSLLFTLTELDEVDRVQPLVEGKQSLVFEGHGVIEEPLERGEIQTFPIFIDEERAEWLQQRADEGIEVFRTDPLEAARFDGRMVGLTAEDDLNLVEESDGYAEVQLTRDGTAYVLEMVQPVREGEGGIWLISNVEKK